MCAHTEVALCRTCMESLCDCLSMRPDPVENVWKRFVRNLRFEDENLREGMRLHARELESKWKAWDFSISYRLVSIEKEKKYTALSQVLTKLSPWFGSILGQIS